MASPPRRGTDKPPTTTPPVSPLAFLREAIAAVPAVKYALGVGGIAAVIAIVGGFLDLRVALVGVPVSLVLMFILVIFSRFAQGAASSYRHAVGTLVWFAVVVMIACTSLFAITFFIKADLLSKWGIKSFYDLFDITPSAKVQRQTSRQYIDAFDAAYSDVNSPEKVAQAVERIALFWRQPEQRKELKDWRCQKITADSFYKKSAQYVFDSVSLMQDVDIETRYFDSVSRCVQRHDCDHATACKYFLVPMTDFRLHYSDYFNELHLLEGRDPIANVRTFSFSCEQPQGAPSAGALDCSHADIE